jgi:hypothetical protein
MTDLTKITTPFGLLDAQTQQALRDHLAAGGEVEVFNNGWHKVVGADFYFGSPVTYRAKPKPKPLEFWVNEYLDSNGAKVLRNVHPTKQDADKAALSGRIRCIRMIEAPDQSEGADLNERQLDAVQQDLTMGR